MGDRTWGSCETYLTLEISEHGQNSSFSYMLIFFCLEQKQSIQAILTEISNSYSFEVITTHTTSFKHFPRFSQSLKSHNSELQRPMVCPWKPLKSHVRIFDAQEHKKSNKVLSFNYKTRKGGENIERILRGCHTLYMFSKFYRLQKIIQESIYNTCHQSFEQQTNYLHVLLQSQEWNLRPPDS